MILIIQSSFWLKFKERLSNKCDWGTSTDASLRPSLGYFVPAARFRDGRVWWSSKSYDTKPGPGRKVREAGWTDNTREDTIIVGLSRLKVIATDWAKQRTSGDVSGRDRIFLRSLQLELSMQPTFDYCSTVGMAPLFLSTNISVLLSV